MDLRIFVEPQQGSDYDEQLRCALLAEELGFDGFFRSDHYLQTVPEPTALGPTDSWITLAGLARETRRIRLGTLVTAATLRHPGPFAIAVAQVDRMSGGRVELGIGAGWYRLEHEAWGLPFPERRFSRLEETLEILTGIWSTPPGTSYGHEGAHWTLTGAPGIATAQSPIPIILGGRGPDRVPRLAARFAQEFIIAFADEDTIADRFARVRRSAEDIGRDPDDLVYSVALATNVGTDRADYERRVHARGLDPAAFRTNAVAGTPAEAIEKIHRVRELGASRVYLQTRLARDLELVELLGREVLPHL